MVYNNRRLIIGFRKGGGAKLAVGAVVSVPFYPRACTGQQQSPSYHLYRRQLCSSLLEKKKHVQTKSTDM